MPGNALFNAHISRVRIRSENAIGYLKGRFQSLKSLRILIKNKRDHQLATYWILACVVIHNIALDVEAEQRAEDEEVECDPFYEGCDMYRDDAEAGPPSTGTRLEEGKQKRAELRAALFCAHGLDANGQ
jgi:hypothetical protein